MDRAKKYYNWLFGDESGFIKCVLMVLSIILLTNVLTKNSQYFEIDSYALPVISLQYRASIIMNQDDLEKAQTDFPTLYTGINSYDDLRSSKLVKIDDNRWLSYYFPVYAIICMPMKLLLQFFHLDQSKTFVLTNVLIYLFTLWYFIKHIQKKFNHKFLILLFLIINPMFYYLQYIGGEPVMFSLVILSIIFWEKRKYKLAAFLISITSMMNPTVMGIGIVMFIEYCVQYIKINKENIFHKKGIIETIKLCCCYIPSLIPFITNLILIGKLNPTMGGGTSSGWTSRVLAYFFDLNLGIASISFLLVILFLVAFIYSILCKNQQMFFEALAVIFTVMCFSLMIHINCGMLNSARYVIWIYPVVIFTIIPLFNGIAQKINKFIQIGIILLCLFVQSFVFVYNRGYSYLEFNRLSKKILNNYPQFYISWCDSTFKSRTEHIDGAYDIDRPVIYVDETTQEIRKILYRNTEEDRQYLQNSIKSEDDTELKIILAEIGKHKDESFHYYNIDKNSNIQYFQKTAEEKGEIVETTSTIKLGEIEDASYSDTFLIQQKFWIEANTLYKIKIQLSEENYKLLEELIHTEGSNWFVDFYNGTDNYDSPLQEVNKYVVKSNELVFLLKTNDEIPKSKEAYVRFVCSGNNARNLALLSFDIIKMQEIN